MSEKIKLTKIELKTQEGKEISLSIDEAKELHDQLHELFGKKETVFVSSHSAAPIIIERDRYPWRDYRPFWATTTDRNTPTYAPSVISCTVEGNSGLSVSYKGSEI
jgi:hypothetical protein